MECADRVGATLHVGAVDDTTCTFLGRDVTVTAPFGDLTIPAITAATSVGWVLGPKWRAPSISTTRQSGSTSAR